jgi:hypothetical protein
MLEVDSRGRIRAVLVLGKVQVRYRLGYKVQVAELGLAQLFRSGSGYGFDFESWVWV